MIPLCTFADVSDVGLPPAHERAAIGGGVQQLGSDVAFGLQLTSPSFIKGVRATAASSLAFLTHGTSGGHEAWFPYSHTRVVLEVGTYVRDDIRIYLLGGPQLLLLPSRLNPQTVWLGGLGGMGIEFNFLNPEHTASAFLELGAMGSPATASEVPTSPILGSGFFLNAGMLFYL